MKSVLEFQQARAQGRPISVVTCYDYTSARILAASCVDAILVGDSLAMTMLGHGTTLPVTAELVAHHTEAVRRGAGDRFIIADMPFLAHRGSLDRTLESVRRIMTAGAQALKIEGIEGAEDTINHIVESGVPVMGHLGLTPQSIHRLGGSRVQGTQDRGAELLLAQARRLEACGAFALVLECVPAPVAAFVTQNLAIPTIGIGAGPECSGQVLVLQDLLGLNCDFQPRFVRRYLEGFTLVQEALDHFDRDVKSGAYPAAKECY